MSSKRKLSDTSGVSRPLEPDHNPSVYSLENMVNEVVDEKNSSGSG